MFATAKLPWIRLGLIWCVGLVIETSPAAGDNPPGNADLETVPGTVIDHQPAESGKYIGSPSIAILPDGSYVASHDIFGPGSRFSRSKVFGSRDRGETWQHLSDIDGAFWSTLFTHRASLYIMGAQSRYGNTVIRRSDDGGRTWTNPIDGQNGLLLTDAKYHCSPQPVLIHAGRIWRAMEDAEGPVGGWAKHFRAFMMSAPIDADLLDADRWTVTNRLACNVAWLDGRFGGWLEGNAVVAPDGHVVNILRVEYPNGGGKAAVVDVSRDGRTVSFDPKTGFVDLPGGSTKFTIRFDPVSKHYWTLSNYVPPRHQVRRPGAVRNTLALVRSADLCNWEVRHIVAYHPEVTKHGFQYPDWQFEGDDVVAVSRTAYDDGLGGAHNYHDANYMTFHRLTDFRNLNDPELPPPVKTTAECPEFVVEGLGFDVATLDNAATAYGNRNYVWQDVPEPFRGWRYTRVDGGVQAELTVTASRDTMIHAATAAKQEGTDTAGWEVLDGQSFHYSDKNRSTMLIMRRPLAAGQTLKILQTNWSGTVVLIPLQEK